MRAKKAKMRAVSFMIAGTICGIAIAFFAVLLVGSPNSELKAENVSQPPAIDAAQFFL